MKSAKLKYGKSLLGTAGSFKMYAAAVKRSIYHVNILKTINMRYEKYIVTINANNVKSMALL